MAKRSSNEDIELKSINNDNASQFEEENHDIKNLDHLLDEDQVEKNETTPFITTAATTSNESELTNEPDNDNEDTQSKNEAEVEAFLKETTSPDEVNQVVETETPTENRIVTLLKENIALVLGFSVIILMGIFVLVLIPNCIYSLEYYQMALSRNKWTGVVDSENTLLPGLHLMLPWKELVKYEKTAANFQITQIPIYTSDALSVKCSFDIYYMFEPATIGQFFRKFGEQNARTNEMIKQVLKSVVQNEGVKFSIEDFRTKRVYIMNHLQEKLKTRLKEDYFINVINMFMHKLAFTDTINQLNLLVVLNKVYFDRDYAEQQGEFVTLNTKVMVNTILNEAHLELQTTMLKSNFTIIERAKTDAYTKIEITYLNQLTKSVKELNFIKGGVTNKGESQRVMSYCYLSSLINTNSSVKYSAPIDGGVNVNLNKYAYLSGSSGLI